MTFGPILPKNIVIRHGTRGCPWYASLPDAYPVSVATTASGMIIGTETFSEDALALMATGSPDPSNLAQLQSLDRQFAADYLSWRTPQFDTTYAGIAAVVPQGIIDTIEWDYAGSIAKTRIFTYPHNFSYRQLGHQIPGLDGICSDGTTGQVSTKTPCVEVYTSPVHTGNTNSDFKIYKEKICLYDGRLREVPIGYDEFDCGCGSNFYICVQLCRLGIANATVNIYYPGGALYYTCITGANGCCPSPPTISGTYDFEVIYMGVTLFVRKTFTVSGSPIVFSSNGGSLTSNFVCCGPAPSMPVPINLTLTGVSGPTAFVYGANPAAPTSWFAQQSFSTRLTATAAAFCPPNPNGWIQLGPGDVLVAYYGTCSPNSGDFTVTILWSTITYNSDGPVRLPCFPSTDGWFGICSGGVGCPNPLCVYASSNVSQFPGGGISIIQPPSSLFPFMWSGSGVPPGGICPSPNLSVSISGPSPQVTNYAI